MMRSTSRAFAHSLGFGVAAIALLPAAAMAQAGAPNSVDDSANEIIVTAQKRAENVQDIPKPVEVLSSKTLVEAGINNVQDLARLSPSIQGAGGQGTENAPPAIRGIASFAYSIGVQSQTGLVLDDIPQPNFSTLASELSDVERVEILPGPQSTLSGRNAAGGLINIVTRSPSSTLKANLTAEVTDDHQKRFAGYVTGPISDTLGFSLSGFWNDWDGPLYNRATGDRLGGYDRYGFRGKLKWQPTDRLSATLTGFYVENKAQTAGLTAGYAYVGLSDTVSSLFAPGVPIKSLIGYNPGPYSHYIYSAEEGRTKTQDYGGSLRLDYDTDIGTISSISSISRSDNVSNNPLVAFGDTISFFANHPVTQNYTVNYKTQEFRLASPTGDSKLQYTLGAIYTDTKIDEPYIRTFIAPVNWDRASVTRSVALYGRMTYEAVPGTFLTGGLRYQHDYQRYDWNFLDGSAPRSTGSNKYDFVAGEASIRQEFGNHVNAYATYSNAQTGKAYDLEDSGSATTPAGLQPLASEKVQNYELGLKTQWLNNRLTFNIGLFNANYKNYQIQSAFFDVGAALPTIRLFSIGRVRTRGIELSGSYAATPDLRFNAAATWMDAEIRDYPNPICYTGQTDQASCIATIGGLPNPAFTNTQANLGGTDMPGAAHFKAIGSVNYTLRMPSMPFDLTLGAQGRYQSSVHTFVLNDPASFIKPFGTVNLTLGVQDHDAKYKLQLFVNNVFDKQYYLTLARDTVVGDPGGSTTPTSLIATYARDSRRYGGLRLTIDY